MLSQPVQSRATTATLPPVLVRPPSPTLCYGNIWEARADVEGLGQSKTVDDDPLCWLGFTPDAILTSCKSGKWACFFLVEEWCGEDVWG